MIFNFFHLFCGFFPAFFLHFFISYFRNCSLTFFIFLRLCFFRFFFLSRSSLNLIGLHLGPRSRVNSIMIPQYVLQVFARVEHMNSNSPIESGRFQEPQVFAFVLRRSNLKGRTSHFFILNLHLQQSFVYLFKTQITAFLQSADHLHYLFKPLRVICILEIDGQSQRNYVINVYLSSLGQLLHIHKKLVFCGESLMALHVIYQLFETIF